MKKAVELHIWKDKKWKFEIGLYLACTVGYKCGFLKNGLISAILNDTRTYHIDSEELCEELVYQEWAEDPSIALGVLGLGDVDYLDEETNLTSSL